MLIVLPVANAPAPTIDGGPVGRSEAVTGITIFCIDGAGACACCDGPADDEDDDGACLPEVRSICP